MGQTLRDHENQLRCSEPQLRRARRASRETCEPRDVRQMASETLAPSSGTLTATAPSRTASDTADSPLGRRVQWLNTRFKVNTTITVEVMLDPKMTWKSLGKC